MSRSAILSQFTAGVFLVNAVPHGVAGVQGRRFPSPFARPPGRGLSSPTVNVAWSAVNAAAGMALLRRNRTTGENVAVGVGAAIMAIFLSLYFEKSDRD